MPEREAQPRIFRGLLHLVVHLGQGPEAAGSLVTWELGVLSELGYGLDLSRCAVTGTQEALLFVSPKTGRAVSKAAAGQWRERLLPLPAFLRGSDARPSAADLCDGLRLTGHFLARDAFGARHVPVPAARVRLYDRLAALAGDRQEG